MAVLFAPDGPNQSGGNDRWGINGRRRQRQRMAAVGRLRSISPLNANGSDGWIRQRAGPTRDQKIAVPEMGRRLKSPT
jgi:hypothetical protein